MTHLPTDPHGHLDIEQLQAELDAWYDELLEVQGAEPDVGLLKVAELQARASALRAKVSRYMSVSRAATAFLSREIDPFLEMLNAHALLHQRAASIRRAGGR